MLHLFSVTHMGQIAYCCVHAASSVVIYYFTKSLTIFRTIFLTLTVLCEEPLVHLRHALHFGHLNTALLIAIESALWL